MGERQVFQPLTKEDRITVLLYRTGILVSAVVIAMLAYVMYSANGSFDMTSPGRKVDILLFGLYASVGLSVFFIHLYITRLKTYLKYLYYVAVACLLVMLYIGGGSPFDAVVSTRYSLLLLLPVSGCLGFVTAKEAFCFRLIEGYIIAMLMPLFVLMAAVGAFSSTGAAYVVIFVSLLLILFTLRKVFMPIAWDIGDKSAYR